jgi:hypothetical protein
MSQYIVIGHKANGMLHIRRETDLLQAAIIEARDYFKITKLASFVVDDDKISIMITIGGTQCFALNNRNDLLVHDIESHETTSNLGPLTQQRAKELSEYLQRLAIHTPER